MTMNKKVIICIAALALFTFISGAGMLALASPGTQTDPVVTLSYLMDIFRPRVMTDAAAAAQETTQNIDARITALESQLQSGQGAATAAPDAANKFSVVTLSKGQSLTCPVGAEIMLRIGTATGSGSAPALVDYTTGETLSSGSALTVNHMYLVTIEGNGINATADTVRVLVRGSYRIT